MSQPKTAYATFALGCAMRLLARRYAHLPSLETSLLLNAPHHSRQARLEAKVLPSLHHAHHHARDTDVATAVPPLLLLLERLDDATLFALLVMADLAVAFCLRRLAPSSLAPSLCYILAPWTCATAAALCTISLPLSAVLGAICLADGGREIASALCLGVATFVSPDAVWLLPATCALLPGRRPPRGRLCATYLGVLLALLAASRLAAGSWHFCVALKVWASPTALRPNFGIMWYLLAQVFPIHRSSFHFALGVLPKLCLAPLVHRISAASARPAAAISLLLVTAYAPHPTANELTAALALVASTCDARLISKARRPPMFLGAIAVSAAIAMHPLLERWLVCRELNPNFAFADTVALAAALSLLALDLAKASIHCEREDIAALRLQRAWQSVNGEMLQRPRVTASGAGLHQRASRSPSRRRQKS